MPELEPTLLVPPGPDDRPDPRLERAVHAFADRASTRVDAVAVAQRAAREGRHFGGWGFLGREVPVPAAALFAMLLLLLALALTLSAGGPLLRPADRQTGPVPAVAVEPLPTVDLPVTDGIGDEPVGGVERVELAGDGTLAVTTDLNDPRVTGAGTWSFTSTSGDGVATLTGPFHLAGPDGAWDGTCTGAAWDGLNDIAASCWLIGSGDYDGLAWYRQFRWRFADHWDFTDGTSRGAITPGGPPAN